MKAFLKGFFLDPSPHHKPSMSRLCAFILTLLTAWAVFHCGVGMVTALVGGGVVSLLVRHKAGRPNE
jgi:hypothetical protein